MCYNMWMGKGKPIHDAVLSNLENNVDKFIGKTCPFWREVGHLKADTVTYQSNENEIFHVSLLL